MIEQKIIEVLDRYGIEYWTDGKNVTLGWVNIKCPFCNDHSNHMGIDPDTLMYSCWRCRESGHFTWLVHKLTGIQIEFIRHMIDEGSAGFKKDFAAQIEDMCQPKRRKEKSDDQDVKFPDACHIIDEYTDSRLLDYYLERRDIKLQTLIDNYCLICEAGYHKMRIIIPIFFDGELVSWQAADMTGRAKEKYTMCPDIDVNNYLYKYEEIDTIMVPVEGILDQWRMGKGTVCTFGTSLTDRQKVLIKDKNLEALIFAWDGEAYNYARKMAEEMAPYIDAVGIARLPWGADPDDLGHDKSWQLVAEAEFI